MCGIAGYFGSAALPQERVDRCLRLMMRRGPDAQASFHTETPAGQHVWLLHSRLSIIDLDRRADQPMHDDGRTIVFNGEIYNFLELRRALEARGETFRTSGDTEVLLRLLVRDGM